MKRLRPVEVVEPALIPHGPIVTFTSGQISCTARAMICARSCRISSSAGASSFSVFRLIVASLVIGHCRSQCLPSTIAEIDALASEGQSTPPLRQASRPPETHACCRREMSGKSGPSAVSLVSLAPTKRPVGGLCRAALCPRARPKSSHARFFFARGLRRP